MSKFRPRLEDYTLGDVIDAERRMVPAAQEIKIQSEAPIRCSAATCRKDITNRDGYIIIGTPHGTVVWHLHCLGIERYGDFNDPSYAAHIRRRLLQVIGW